MSPARTASVLELPLQGATYHFATLADLDFALVARTSVPPQRLQALYASSIPALEADTIKLRTLELQLDGILEDLDQHGIPVADSLARTGIGMISKDHDWRDVFAQLLRHADRGKGYARLVLLRYLEFLAERRAMLNAVLTLKRACAAHRGVAPTAAGDGANATVAMVASNPRAAATAAPVALARLPHGRAVVLELAAGRQVEITLARHRFALAHERDWTLVTEDGRRFVLQPGLNSVGRSRANTVAVDGTLSNVSRTHLLAEPLDADRIALTDLSSSGTFIASTAIAS